MPWDGWALATSATAKQLAQALRDALPRHGLRVVETTTGNATVADIYGTSEGAHLIVEHGRPNPALARTICAALDVPARFLELTLEDTTVSATLTELPHGATAKSVCSRTTSLPSSWLPRRGRLRRSEACREYHCTASSRRGSKTNGGKANAWR